MVLEYGGLGSREGICASLLRGHARIIHPDGRDGFTDENLAGLSSALGDETRCQ